MRSSLSSPKHLITNGMEGRPKEEAELLNSPPPRPGCDRLKRDEWSEGAVECLLEAYESKWILRNRAKLKGQDWEDVARQVSTRAAAAAAGSSRSAKTATQCKNKIESMKKRYRNEVAAGSGSRWPLFSKLDGLVRCKANSATAALVVVDDMSRSCDPHPAPLQAGAQASQSAEHNGVAAVPQEDRMEGEEKLQANGTRVESDLNIAPTCNSSRENPETATKIKKRKRAGEEGCRVTESIQWLAEVILRVEQSRMETMKELEKIRADAEARRGEMDLKRTEIIANTQLQIAKLIARRADRICSSSITGRDFTNLK